MEQIKYQSRGFIVIIAKREFATPASYDCVFIGALSGARTTSIGATPRMAFNKIIKKMKERGVTCFPVYKKLATA